MSLSSTTNKVREEGDGLEVDFDTTFPVQEASHLAVYKVVRATDVATLQTITTDYTVSISAVTRIATVTYVEAPTALEDSLIVRTVPLTQGADIPTNNIFREVQIENALDKQMMAIQQLQEQINRALLVGVAEEDVPTPDEVSAAVAAAEAAQTGAEAAEDAAVIAQAAAEAAAASVPSTATFLAAAMPVGFVLTLGVSTNPATLYGFGTWAAIAGRVIVGINAGDAEFDTLDETGGAKTHTLTTDEIPSHNHTTNQGQTIVNPLAGGSGAYQSIYSAGGTAPNAAAGGGQAHNNLQPYIVKYVWQRTA
jgi:hypothetical protein